VLDIKAENKVENTASFFGFGTACGVSTTAELANRACQHAFTSLDTTRTGEEADPFAYTTVATSRYGSAEFMGIMIDTGASKRSTVGYSQYLALKATSSSNLDLNESTKGLVNV
jgi:hypothetical protein